MKGDKVSDMCNIDRLLILNNLIHIKLFRFIEVFYGTDSILWNTPHNRSKANTPHKPAPLNIVMDQNNVMHWELSGFILEASYGPCFMQSPSKSLLKGHFTHEPRAMTTKL